MTTLKNDRFLRALLRQPVDRTPAWIMRQAGRYLPEYRATRAKAGNFLTMCKTPEIACEVTLQPLARFPLDAAILFSDILTIPDAMGLGLHFVEGEGPKFHHPVRSGADIARLAVPDVGHDLRYVTDAVSLIRRELQGQVPLIGFSGSPWTLATYMVEGGGGHDFERVKGLLYSDPAALEKLLTLLVDAVIAYLNAQIEAGAQAVQIFDTWGGVLSTPAYERFSLAPMQRIVQGLIREREGRRVPVILFTKGGGGWLEKLATTGADALGLDWATSLAQARRRTDNKVALQGNMDPAVLYATPDAIRDEVARVLADFGQVERGSGHVFNLGHGITPGVNPDHLGAALRAVQELSPVYHSQS